MRANILYIINVLRLFSTKEKPMTHEDIRKKLNRLYSSDDNFCDNSTIQRTLNDYICSLHLNDMPDTNNPANILNPRLHANFKIHVLKKNPMSSRHLSEYIDITDTVANADEVPNTDKTTPTTKKKRTKSEIRYYYYEPCIDPKDLSNLMTMIECHPYYNSGEVIQMTETLKSIAPAYFPEITYLPPAHNRLQNPLLQNNLHRLHQYINADEDIKIVYCYYNDRKELVPRKNYQEPKRITPHKILWANGYCYLVAYNPDYKKLTHYRVDRISKIEPISDGTEKEQLKRIQLSLPSVDYAKSHPVMMSDEPEQVRLLCKKSESMVGRLIDSFGMNIEIAKPDYIIKRKFPTKNLNPNEWMLVSFNASPAGISLWAKQHCTECIIDYPQELAEKIKQELEDSAKMYL